MVVRFFLVITMVAFQLIPCYSQFFDETIDVFQKMTVEDGLSQNTVNCILRDKAGSVWFGTRNGLNRFDGKKNIIIEKDFGQGKNLKDYYISSIYKDSKEIIWIGYEQGIVKYDPTFEKFERYIIPGGGKRGTSVLCIEPENDGRLWLGTNDGLKLFDTKSSAVVDSYSNEPYQPYSIANNNVYSICKVGNNLMLGHENGIDIFNTRTKTFERFKYNIKNLISGGTSRVRKIIMDYRGHILIGSEGGGLTLYDPQNNYCQNFNTNNSKIPHNDIRDIFDLKNGSLWLATNGGGISLFDQNVLTFKNVVYDPTNINGLSNNSIYSVVVDNEGILWVGSYSGGVNYNVSRVNDFKTMRHLPGNENCLIENNARSLMVDSKNRLWVGTLGGLSMYDPSSRKYYSYRHNNQDISSLSFNTITAIYEDAKKDLWVGTYSGGLNLLKPGDKGFKHYSHYSEDSNSISSNNIYCIKEDFDDNLYVATSAGINCYNRKTDKWERYGNLDVRDICISPEGKIYLAVYGGIAEFNSKSKAINFHRSEDISYVPTTTVCYNKEGEVLFGTQGEGLGIYNSRTSEFKIFTISDGLPSNFISSVIKYDDENFWISSYQGISLFNRKSGKFINFNLSDGIPFLEFHPRSVYQLPDQSIAFGGTNGVLFFDPKKLISSTDKTNLILSSLKIYGKQVSVDSPDSPLKRSINLTHELNLKYRQNDFSVEFVDINFRNKGAGSYVYKLENYFDDWRNVETQNIVGFTNMSPGSYILRIKNAKSSLMTNEARIRINIIPPFWMRWYFFTFLGFLVLGIIYLYNRYSLISINQKNEIKLRNLEYEKHEEFNKMRMRFFTYISHELRTPLSLIIDPIKRISQINKSEVERKYLHLIEKNADRMMRLVDQILDFRKLESDTLKLSVSENNISQLIADITGSFEETAMIKNVDLSFSNNAPSDLYGWIDSDKIEKIMYNLLSNSFKFTETDGEIEIRLNLISNSGSIEISIKDTGCGMSEEQLTHIFDLFYTDESLLKQYRGGVGVGLNYVKRLIDLHHGTITVKSILNMGSEFLVTLPIRKESYTHTELAYNLNIIKKKETSSSAIDAGNLEIQIQSEDTPLILVVEDEDDLRKYLAHNLSSKYRVLEAENGKVALEMTKLHHFDLVLSDNIMPEMNGIELCNILKSDENFSLIPFVFLSAWNSDDFKLQGLKSGADDYLSKPFNMELLELRIAGYLSTRKKYIEIAQRMLRKSPGQFEFTSSDEQFIFKAQKIIESNIDRPDFTTKDFEDSLFMSHSAIYRKLKELTGLSANEYIREYRLRRACQILFQDKNLNVAEVSLMVGFIDTKYFSQCFKKLYGMSPSDYVKNERAKL